MASRRNRRNLQRKKRSTRRSCRKQQGGMQREGRALCIKRMQETGLSTKEALIECAKDDRVKEYEDQWNIN